MEARQEARRKLGNHLMPDWDAAHQYEYQMAIALDAGDEQRVNELVFNAKRDDVAQSLESNFDVSVKKGGAISDRGKLQIKKTPIHGRTNDQENIDALMMTYDNYVNGSIVDENLTPHDRYIQQAAAEVLSPQAISTLAAPGLRDGVAGLSDENRIGRAGDRVVEYGNGIDPRTGVLIAGMPTDGGHGENFPHNKYPEFSEARFNMGAEQGYVNKVKGDRTGDEAALAIRNSLKKKMHNDDSGDMIRQVVNGYQVGEGFPEDRAEVAQKFLNDKMNNVRDDSPDQERDLVINSGGGNVTIGDNALRKNGNGHDKPKRRY